MSENLESLYEKALRAAAPSSSKETYDKAIALAHSLATKQGGSEEWGDVRSKLFLLIESELKKWIKANPPNAGIYTDAQPMGAFYAFEEIFLGSIKSDPVTYREISNIISFSKGTFEKTSKKAIAAHRTSGKNKEQERVAAAFPRYKELGREIRAAKKEWAEANRQVKGTHAFRMMGGLARMGLPAGRRYSTLVDEAQRMEKAVLGKVLTGRTGV